MSEKPCPFCGATPIWSICGENNDLLRFGCPNNCAVWMEPFTRPYHENALKSVSKRWNHRAQPANEPLTLEQLREMDGEPAWIVDIKHSEYSGWMQHAYDDDEYNLVAFWIFGNEVESTYSVDDYGNTWLAYCRKPEAINGK